MPSKSEAQHKYIAMMASQGKMWAQKWLHEDKGWKKLPKKLKKKKRG